MSLSNITVSTTSSNVTVDSNNTNVSVAQTTSNVIVGAATFVSNSAIREAISNVSPILYDNTTGVISIDSAAIFSGKTTDDLAEGSTNLYFKQNANNTTTGTITAGAFVGDGTGLSNVSTLTNAQVVAHIATVPLTVGGNLQVNGNLDVAGNLNYENVTDLYVTDQKITLNSNATTDANVEIISNRPQTTSTKIKWNEDTDKWTFTNDGSTFYNLLEKSESDLVQIAGTQTITGDKTHTGKLTVKNFVETYSDQGNVAGGTLTFDANNGTIQEFNLVANVSTLNMTNFVAGNSGTMILKQDAVGQRVFTSNFSPTWKWVNNDSTLTTNPNKSDILTFVYDGSNFYGSISPIDDQGTIPNSELANSNVVVNGVTIELGSSGTIVANTDLTAFSVATNSPSGNGSLAYSNTTGVFTFTPANTSGLGISLTDLSVTQASASGTGTLEYSNVSGVFTYTPPDLSSFVTNAQAQAYIQSNGLAMTANITSNSLISTTGNVQFNADTDVSGLSGLTFDSSTNNLGLGTPTPGAALHIRGTSNEAQIFMTEYNGTSSAGIDLRTFRAGGDESSPSVTPKADRIWEALHYTYDGVGSSGDGVSTGFQNAFSEQIITDPSVDHAANLVPVFKQFHTYLDGDATTTPHALMRMRSNGDIQFNMTNAFSYTGAANTVISKDGIITTNGNVTSLANINAAGGTLTGILTSDSNVVTTAFFEGDLNGAVTIDVNNNTGAQLTKGEAVYLTGGNSGDNPNVALANNQVAANMPAIGIVRENIADQAIGQVVTSGVMNLASHGLTLGADLFIGTGGGITETKPTGESGLIQKIGKVVSANHIIVQGAFRTNATPNLNENNIFIGNAANQATTVSLTGLTSNVKTTGNLQVNPDTIVGGLSGLTFDSATNRLGLGTNTPGAGLHITSGRTSGTNDAQLYMTEFNGTSSAGIDFRTYSAGGTGASPTVRGVSDRIFERFHYAYDGDGSTGDGNFTGFKTAFAEQVITDPSVTHTANTVPVFHQFYTYIDGDVNTTPHALMRLRSNGDIQFNMDNAFSYTNAANTVIAHDGTITTAGNITTTANVSGGYILGNGSALTGIATDTFDQIIVSGQSNVDASGPTALTLAESGDISITTDAANNTVTIGGSGGGYGNANVTNFLSSATSVGNVAFTGNLIVESGNTSYSPSSYEGNVTSGTIDQVVFTSDPGFYEGQPILFSGTINSNLTFLNGNVYYVKGAGVSNTYSLFTDVGLLTGLTSGLGTEAPNSLAGSVRNESNQHNEFYGNVDISRGAHLNVHSIKSYVPGGTFSMSGIRASDVGIGNYFMPDTGGTTEGAVLTAHSDGAATFDVGLDITSDSTVDVLQVTHGGNTSVGTEEKFKRARASTSSPQALQGGSAADRIHEVEYSGHDGTDYRMTFGEHVYVDTSVASVAANIVPLTKEFFCEQDGDVNHGFNQSIMKLRANRHIEFNANGTRGFGTQGNANVQMDGSIYSAATVDALNVSTRQFLSLKNYSNTEILALTGMSAGDVVFNSTDNTIAFYEGSNWKNLTVTGNVT